MYETFMSYLLKVLWLFGFTIEDYSTALNRITVYIGIKIYIYTDGNREILHIRLWFKKRKKDVLMKVELKKDEKAVFKNNKILQWYTNITLA